MVSEQDKELQITPGLAEVKQGMNADVILPRTGARIDFGDAIYHPENVAHATLYADAHNTYNTCKKLPSALLRERNEAVDLLYEAARYADEVTDSEGATEFAQRVRTFLSALTPDKK